MQHICSYCCLYLSVDYGIIENSCVSIATAAVFLSQAIVTFEVIRELLFDALDK